ncbi:MAG: histidine phosphatase family protein [Leptothrix sp. (in: b-proteobacteria)]
MLTRVCFLRHATAQEYELGLADADRQLTDKGLRQVRAVASFCERQSLRPDVLLTSPLLRAVQTATVLSQHLRDCPPPETVDWLRIGTPTAEAWRAVQARQARQEGALWLVGHEPQFSDLISRLLGSATPIVQVKKASLSCVELDADTLQHGQLLWSVPCALMG